MRRIDLRLASLLLLLVGCSRGGSSTEVPEPQPLVTDAPEAEPTSARAKAPEGPLRYRGEVAVPGGDPLEMFVELTPEGEGWAGTITVPEQMVFDAALGEIVVAPGELSFTFVAVGARVDAELGAEGTVSACHFAQSGVELSCSLEPISEEQLAAIRNPPRPQTPQPPFPYDAVEVEYDNEADGIHLAGTLTLPEGAGPFPAALLITGSGAQDRDETLVGHKPFAVLSDHLTREGIAVLRVDDRGVGGSTGTLSEADGAALARDVAAGVAFLREHERIDPARVGLIGHSEGGILGPRVAAEDPKIAFVVMMAGTGVPGSEVIREQAVAVLRAKGVPPATIELIRNREAQALSIVTTKDDIDEARAELEPIVGAAKAQSMISPWFRAFVRYDPAPALRRLRCPVLVLQGELDLQVLPDQNLPVIEEALRSNRKRVTVHRLPGLNHLFQAAKTGSPEEYASIEQTIEPEVLELIGDWVVAQTSKVERKRKR